MNVPRIESVTPLQEKRLLVTFVNGIQKVYDCQSALNSERFQLLKHEAFFKAVAVDPGGYGISWDDEKDLSEYELWNNGLEVEQRTVESTPCVLMSSELQKSKSPARSGLASRS